MLKIKNTQNEFNSRLDTIDAKISELEDTTETIQKCNTNRKKIEKKKKKGTQHQWAVGQLQRAYLSPYRRRKEDREIFEAIISEVFKLMKTINPQIQETQWTTRKRNMKKTKLHWNKEETLKTARGKKDTFYTKV